MREKCSSYTKSYPNSTKVSNINQYSILERSLNFNLYSSPGLLKFKMKYQFCGEFGIFILKVKYYEFCMKS